MGTGSFGRMCGRHRSCRDRRVLESAPKMGRFLVPLSDVNLDRRTFKSFLDLYREPDWRARANFMGRLHEVLGRLPPTERDAIELYFFQGKRQQVISRVLGLTQQAVSMRIRTALRRVLFLLDLPSADPDQMRHDLGRIFAKKPVTAKVLCDFAHTTCQAETARRMGLTQGLVHFHLSQGMRLLQRHDSVDALFYSAYFGSLLQRPNILRSRNGKRATARRLIPCSGNGNGTGNGHHPRGGAHHARSSARDAPRKDQRASLVPA